MSVQFLDQKAKQSESQATELLGEIVAWDMKSTEVSTKEIELALVSAGITADMPELRATSAFSRAKKSLNENRIIRKAPANSEGQAAFQFTVESVDDEGGKLEYVYEAKVLVDKETGKATCEEDQELAAKASGLIQHALSHRTASDITKIVQRLFDENGDLFPVSPKKGVAYFVPSEHSEFCEKVQLFYESLGGTFSRFPVPKNHEQSKKSVRESVSSGLSAMLSDLKSAVGEWQASTRDSTTEKALERWNQVSAKAEAYSMYLQDQTARIDSELLHSKKAILKKIQDLKKSRLESPPEDCDVPF